MHVHVHCQDNVYAMFMYMQGFIGGGGGGGGGGGETRVCFPPRRHVSPLQQNNLITQVFLITLQVWCMGIKSWLVANAPTVHRRVLCPFLLSLSTMFPPKIKPPDKTLTCTCYCTCVFHIVLTNTCTCHVHVHLYFSVCSELVQCV